MIAVVQFLLQLLACVSFYAALVSSTSVSWDKQNVVVKQFDELNVTCTATDLSNLDVVRIELRTTSGVQLTLADGRSLKTPFSTMERYIVKYQNQYRDRTGSLTVFYKGIRGEDAGTLICSTLSESDHTAQLKLHINVPAKEVFLVAVGPDGSRTRVSPDSLPAGTNVSLSSNAMLLREKEERGIICVSSVIGSLTPPTLSLTVGNHDCIQYFTAAEESKDAATESAVNSLGSLSSELTLTHVTMFPERRWNGQTLKCIATQEGYPPIIATAALRVEYVPVVTCEAYEHHTAMGGPYSIACEVASNPLSRIMWLPNVERGASKPLMNGDNIKLSEMVEAAQSDTTRLVLTIQAVEMNHYGMYLLIAANDIGSSEVAIVLYPAAVGIVDMSQMGQYAAMQELMPPEMQMLLSSRTTSAATCQFASSVLMLAILTIRWILTPQLLSLS